jgi:hypothetical protein
VSGRCGGLHCPGCGDGDGVALVAVVVALAVIGAILHAIWHALVEAAEIAALVVLSVAGAAAAAGLGYAVLRVGASIARARHQAAPKAVIISRVDSRQLPAIEPTQRASWPLPGQWEEIPTDINRRN